MGVKVVCGCYVVIVVFCERDIMMRALCAMHVFTQVNVH